MKNRANCLLHDPTRIDLLFTMSEITHEGTLVRMDNMRSDVFADGISGSRHQPAFALSGFGAAAFASIRLAEP